VGFMRGEVARFVPRGGAVVSTGWNGAAGGREASRRRPPEVGGGESGRWAAGIRVDEAVRPVVFAVFSAVPTCSGLGVGPGFGALPVGEALV